MNMIINPIVSLLDRMNFRKRFLFISILLFVTLLGIASLYLTNEINERHTLSEEKAPSLYFEPVSALMQHLSASRQAHLLAAITKEETFANSAREADKNVDNALAELKRIESQGWKKEKVSQIVSDVEGQWSTLKIAYERSNPEELYTQGSAISFNLVLLMTAIFDESNLSLDVDAISYNLIDVFQKYGLMAAQASENVRDLGMLALHSENNAALREQMNYWLANVDTEDGSLKSGIHRLYDMNNSYRKLFAPFVETVERNNIHSIAKRYVLQKTGTSGSISEYANEMNGQIRNYYGMAEAAYKVFNEHYTERLNIIDQHIIYMALTLAIAFLFISFFFIAFYKSTDRAVQTLINTANAAAQGDLSQKIATDRKDEFGLVMNALSNMQGKIGAIVQEIKNTSSIVARGAKEISQGNLDLSKRTEQQASSLASTAASMEELSVTVKENANQSKKAAELAENARKQADSSGVVVNEAVEAMTQINESSKKIAEISGVIDEIAFQTNLLALNAAIEAARAGEQGRGFAVVAQEVRNLAQRSSVSAKEINTLISDSVEKISSGTKLVTKSGETLQEIVSSASSVSELVSSIATATSQQAKGLEEINKAITQMDGITQQNAALVEETAAASENVNQQVRGLIEQIEFFKESKEKEQITLSQPMHVQPSVQAPVTNVTATEVDPNLKSYVPKFQRKQPPDHDWSEF